ncbi:hemagglutinin [Paraburkholderia sediminicola]|uniref:M30 family zinc metallopeptidase n=1 Tax=Paraburkholderia TaxID=1822464 RepID=UPI0038B99C0C
MRTSRLKSFLGYVAAIAVVLSVAGCGGGGGGSSGGGSSTGGGSGSGGPSTTVSPSADGKLHAACSNCGASSDSAYSGSGTGLWQAINAGTAPVDVPVAISGLSGNKLTYVFTNEGGNQAMPAIRASSSEMSAVSASLLPASATRPGEDPKVSAIAQFNAKGWADLAASQWRGPWNSALVAASAAPLRSVVTYNMGDTRSFYDSDYSQRLTNLRATAKTADGTTVNVWVESSEWGTGKMTQAIVDNLLSKYASAGGVYDMVTSVGGKLYGPNDSSVMIDGTNQPIDLVVFNFNPDSKPYGMVGYFHGLNNFKKGSGQAAYSNESISQYLDSETLYLGAAAGLQAMQTTMAHESTHMQNFYRRAILMGSQYAYETWLEEMSAMMMEDWVSFNIDNTHNAVRDGRYLSYVGWQGQGSYNCSLNVWTPMGTDCDSYSVAGTFGGFLNRQLGLNFYKALLTNKNKTASMDILNDVLNQFSPGMTVALELRHMTATVEGQIPLSAGFADYSFRQRAEGGFTLPQIDPSALARNISAAVPGVLQGLASFPVQRSSVSGTYQETVRVPPGTTLTVVVD